jgi:succinoglycan biosynthesis protein ExoW
MGARGRGVSVYRETLAWDSRDAPDRLIDELLFRKKLLLTYNLPEADRAATKRAATEKLDHLVFLLLRQLSREPLIVPRALRRLRREAPEYCAHIPLSLLRQFAHIRRLRTSDREE